jgi:putative DNA primase/helicase
MTNTITAAQAAVQAAERGWFIAPFRVWKDANGDKQSAGRVGWKAEASNDPSRIEDWWQRWPDAVIGVVTKASGLLVIDLDLHDTGVDGLANWEQLIGQHAAGEIPMTYTVRTPTGGLHLYFTNTDETIKNSASKLAPGVDVRGAGGKSGGIVFGAGSVRYDGLYTVVDDSPVAPLPEWLKELLRDEEEEPESMTVTGVNGQSGGSPWTPEQAELEIERMIRRVIGAQNGRRNIELNNASLRVGRFVTGGFLDIQSATQMLEAAGIEAGLDPDEVRKTVASGLHSDRAKAEPMAREGVGGGRLVLPSPDRPLPVARALENRWKVGGEQALRHWRGDWMSYEDGRYREVSPGEIQNALYLGLENAYFQKTAKDGSLVTVPWNPKLGSVREVMGAMQAVHALDETVEPGTWLDGHGIQGLISVKNGLIDPATRQMLPHSARYFGQYVLPFEYDKRAECPQWLEFLDSVFGGDSESVELLQEWFGYVVSGRTDMEKMMFLKGASRSGKGVTARVLGQLLGRDAMAGPTLSQFGSNFGMASLIGKPLAVIDDARSSSKIDMQAVIERLLTITGRGRIDIDRKNRDIWTGILPTRMMMLSNELPWFRDASGAITGRMLMLVYPNSFLGKEDRTLDAKLQQELPGILNWALAGLDRLTATGLFTQPGEVADAVRELEEQVSPILGFIRDCCEVGVGLEVRTDVLYRAYQRWSEDWDDSKAAQTRFGTQITNAPGQRIDRRKNAVRVDGKLKSIYVGITLCN